MICTISGNPVCPLGLAAYPQQDAQCVGRAFAGGLNFFFFYDLSHSGFIAALKPLVQQRRDDIFLASGSGARQPAALRVARRRLCKAIGSDAIDVFFAEYIHPGDDVEAIFGHGGVLDELQRWKTAGWIRYAGATAHDRSLAKQLAEDSRVDLLMHRFNMAHRKAVDEVFPAAVATETPIIAFTATRWGSLLAADMEIDGQVPSAADCYRYCLSHPAVHVVLTAPESMDELNENLRTIGEPPMGAAQRARWERYGDQVYRRAGSQDAFETRWP